MEPEEYEIWAQGQAGGYNFDQEESELSSAVLEDDLEKVLELIPNSTVDERLDAFDNLILYSKGNGYNEKEIITLAVLLLRPGTTTSYLGLIDAVESYSADFLLPVVKYAKEFIPPKDRLRHFRYTTVPIVRELLDRVEVVDSPSFWTVSRDVLTYLYDMGKIPQELWEKEYGHEPQLPIQDIHGLIAKYY